MKIQLLSVFILLSAVTLTACTHSNESVGQSPVREMHAPNTTSTSQQQRYPATQSSGDMNVPTGDNSGSGTSGTGGRTGSLGSSGGSPYIPPTGGRAPANETRSSKKAGQQNRESTGSGANGGTGGHG